MQFRRQNVLFILLGVSIGIAVFSITSVGRRRAQQDPSPQSKQKIASVPEIVSCVRNIRVAKAEITNAESPDAYLAIEVENTSDVGIIAISLESGREGEAYTELEESFGADEPIVIIEPHVTHNLGMPVANILPHMPLRIGSVMYANGTEEGCDLSLKLTHQLKRWHESQRPKKKGSLQ
jgi:hypothetical protein